MMGFRKRNHYVSKSYLKAWCSNNKIFNYRVIVPHVSSPLWSENSLRRIASRPHLYTLTYGVNESDEIERWMDHEIESPAQIALNKARRGAKLNGDELEKLIRFMALQDVRSPVRYREHLKISQSEMPMILRESVVDAVKELGKVCKGGAMPKAKDLPPEAKMIPVRVEQLVKEEDNPTYALLKTEVLFGRNTWLFSIYHFLNRTYRVLLDHNWSLIKAPKGHQWLTSDNPVIKLNYYQKGRYDFKGGWGSKGTEILFPLSPRYLLYTKIGSETVHEKFPGTIAKKLNKLIAEHAHRLVFAKTPIKNMTDLRPRIVDKKMFKSESLMWKRWHAWHKETGSKFYE